MSRTQEVLREVGEERERQKAAFRSDFAVSDNDWVAFVTAYAGRAAQGVVRNDMEDPRSQRERFRQRMLQVAALAVAAVEAHDASEL